MYSNEKKINRLFLYWLITSLILVFLIIIVGGLTRLTNSGLSITDWELFKGILPPLNSTSWQFYFEQYKLYLRVLRVLRGAIFFYLQQKRCIKFSNKVTVG